MDLVKELAEARQNKQEIINQIRELDKQRQPLLQEALRLEGEVRTLERLSRNGDKPKEKKDA